jgi:hypothetical protein
MLTPEERRIKEFVDKLTSSISDLADKQTAIHRDLRSITEILEKIQAKQESSNPSDNKATNTSDAISKTAPAKRYVEEADQETSHSPKTRSGPNPWLTFIIECVLCIGAVGAFIATGIYAHITSEQRDIMTAQWASTLLQWQTMDKTLTEIQKQTPLFDQSATAAKNSVEESKRGRIASEAQSTSSLNASIATSQLDQRAWVGVADFITMGGTETADRKGFSYQGVQLTIRNSGKTPAINLSAVTMTTSRGWRDKIGNYDEVTAESNRMREAALEKLIEEQIRQNPSMADQIRTRSKEMREISAKAETELFPAGQVLAPGVAMTQRTIGINYENLRTSATGSPDLQIVYILGKVTYNDIFVKTPLHTTEFCIMRRGGTQFDICPTGNLMN